MMPLDRSLSVAPMMGHTHRHFRVLMRLMTRRTLLYTEMLTSGALLHGQAARWLHFDPLERPLALQLGGSDPAALAECAALAADWGYDEVNLNLGCPSARVQAGGFGACLMAEPEKVAACVRAMKAAIKLPVTVKCRIGIDQQDSDEALACFVLPLAEAGCDAFILHARKAWLSGLDPKANRTVPPLDYDRVLRLKRRYPALTICLNGGIRSLVAAAEFWPVLDGVMIGRAAIENPWLFAEADSQWFLGANPPSGSRHAIVRDYLPYLRREMAAGESWSRLSRPLLPLFQGQPGARWWRRHLSTTHHDAGSKTVEEALALLGLA